MAIRIPRDRSVSMLGAFMLLFVAGCGSSGPPAPSNHSANSQSASRSAGALAADATSAATGDIPDNQVFLESGGAGWSMKYPEGWTRASRGTVVTFTDKNNRVRVLADQAAPPSPDRVTAALQTLKRAQPSLSFTAPQRVVLPADPQALRARYTTQSVPDPVTGKSVTLVVDRYVLHHGPLVATVDLGTPTGVDNVDAYKMMIRSFRWR